MFLFMRAAPVACACPSLPTRRLPLMGRIGGGDKPRRKTRIRRVRRGRFQGTFRRKNARNASVAQRRNSPRTSKLGHFLRRKHTTRRVRTVPAVVLYNLLQLLQPLVPLRVWWMKTMMRVSRMHLSASRSLAVRRCTPPRYQTAAGIQRHPHGQRCRIVGQFPRLVVALHPLVELLSNDR